METIPLELEVYNNEGFPEKLLEELEEIPMNFLEELLMELLHESLI